MLAISKLGAGFVLSGMVWAAVAAPQETATFTAVDSIGEFPDTSINESRAFTFVGGYSAVRMHVSGTLVAGNPFTYQTDSRIAVTTPGSSAVTIVQPFATGNEFTTATVTDRVFAFALPVAAAGDWNFRFYETIWDDGAFPDATWQSISFTLDDDSAAPGEILTASAGGVYTEIEDNDSKARANKILALQAGQSITGVSRGALIDPGIQSADYFRVKTAAAPLGIYRHRLQLSSAILGQSGSIRGLLQLSGAIQLVSDIEIQGSGAATSPSRMNQWYGFGKQEEVYYRVAGISATTEPYVATYSVTPVTALVASRNFAPGPITITTIGQGHTTDTDLWIYDGAFNAIPGLGNDDAPGNLSHLSSVTSNFAPGDYYVAIAPYNLANDQASPTTNEDWSSGGVMDFANSVAQSTIDTAVPVSLAITDATGAEPVVATRAGAFEVVWVKFVVGEPPCPADLDDGTGTGTHDGAVTIDDLLFFLVAFENGTTAADLDDGSGTGTHDDAVTIDDLLFFLAHFEVGC